MNWEQLQKWEILEAIESISKEKLISSINESKPVKEKNFDDARIKKMKKGFNELRDRLSKPKIKEIRKDLYEVENKKLK